jgi:hypothetical protein
LLVVFLGCDGSQDVKVNAPVVSPADAAKLALKDVANSGQMGSGMYTVRQNLEKLKSTDPAKAEGLLKDLDQLMALPPGDSAAIKAKAQEMAGKL